MLKKKLFLVVAIWMPALILIAQAQPVIVITSAPAFNILGFESASIMRLFSIVNLSQPADQ